MESFGDKLRALALAMGLHLACILALLAGLWWTHETRPVVMPDQSGFRIMSSSPCHTISRQARSMWGLTSTSRTEHS